MQAASLSLVPLPYSKVADNVIKVKIFKLVDENCDSSYETMKDAIIDAIYISGYIPPELQNDLATRVCLPPLLCTLSCVSKSANPRAPVGLPCPFLQKFSWKLWKDLAKWAWWAESHQR